jgi:hypothetical protein
LRRLAGAGGFDPHRIMVCRSKFNYGLWTLAFGVGGSNGSPDGIKGETHGLFGAIASH